jgi:hypothetical protein
MPSAFWGADILAAAQISGRSIRRLASFFFSMYWLIVSFAPRSGGATSLLPRDAQQLRLVERRRVKTVEPRRDGHPEQPDQLEWQHEQAVPVDTAYRKARRGQKI